jgi:hypothetical protein
LTPKKYRSLSVILSVLLLAKAILIFLSLILEKLQVPEGSILKGFTMRASCALIWVVLRIRLRYKALSVK